MEEKKGFVGYLYCYQLYNESTKGNGQSLISKYKVRSRAISRESHLRAEHCSILCTVAARSDFFPFLVN